MGPNSFTGSIPNLENLRLLKNLYLSSNDLTGEYPNKELGFLSSLSSCRNLREIFLSHNQFNGLLPTSIGNFSDSLQDFFASECGVRGSIPVEIGNIRNLRGLYLHGNELTGFIPRTMGKLKGLTRIYLKYNKLEGLIPSDLCGLSNLGNLYLSYNKLQGPIPKCFSELKSIIELVLTSNKLESNVPSNFWNLNDLVVLDLSINNLSGPFPSGIEKFKVITYLDLSFNSLSGNIPSDIDKAVSLYHLSLAHNKFKSIGNLKSLEFLDVSCNIFSGFIPKSLEGLTYLEHFNVSYNKLEGNIATGGSSCTELVRATNDFRESNKLGRGGTGSFFIGTLSDGLIVAIKVFNLENLIKVIGCCWNQDFKALVLEYMPNGSLDKWLHSHNLFLDLLQRLNIAIDVALALEYLHLVHTFPIVHCDLKPSNVLLDKDMTAHVGDFEYGAHGTISTSGDIFSFRIMLLEICTRKKPTDERFGDEISLKSWVSFSLQENTISEVVDANLHGRKDQNVSARKQCLSSMLCLAMECLTTSPSDRINISEVVSTLEKIRSIFLANNNKVADNNVSSFK
ncbi:Serine/threonine protein kinase [Handroanthus impetiginosus]|uniref:Serine/threonine protein kinase n=1 Tax=Handroanthus impetiginosus TaxID=429701 RepID=A0A2G9HCX8_9LAMI|nr:Serine/threonine protein kinase [Handroanthus impetiginosus]